MIVLASGIVSSQLVTHGPSVRKPAGGAATRPFTSVVLTGDPRLRERLRAVAATHGATCRAPLTCPAGWQAAEVHHGLVFIDVDRPLDGRLDEARALAEVLAYRPGVLLVICGTAAADGAAGDDVEERWARELGVFLYLPGVGSDAGIGLIVAEARRLLENGCSRPPPRLADTPRAD